MAAFTKRLTTNDSLKTQPATTSCAVLSDCLLGVLGTAWCEPAMLTQERTQNKLVGADKAEKNLLHIIFCWANSCSE